MSSVSSNKSSIPNELKAKVSRLEATIADLEFKLYYDPLTGAFTRQYLYDQFSSPLDGFGYLVFMDLDDFKSVNDHYGHAAGDRLLKQIVSCLIATVADQGFVVRMSGDEFIIIIEQVPETDFADLEKSMRAAVSNASIMIDLLKVSRTASFGFIKLDNKMDVPTAVGLADEALLLAKSRGKNRTQGVDRRTRRGTQLLPSVDAVRNALQANEIGYHVQPILQVSDQEIVGYEALLRWSMPSGEVLGPSQFLDTMTNAYNADVCPPLFAARATSEWAVNDRSKYISFNVSEEFLLRALSDGLGWVEDLVGDVPYDQIVFELLETVFDRDNDYVVKAVAGLRRLGVRIALDDFGTGYSSLERLQRLEVDYVKIDKQFVQEAVKSKRGLDIFSSVVDLSRSVGAQSVVEGIETSAHLDLARQTRADLMQGFMLGRPKPIEDY